jgi:hypothetical protein
VTHQPELEKTQTTKSCDCIIARSPEELDQVYRLRYTCYRRKGSIERSAGERFEDPFDRLESTYNFLVRSAQREPLATVRISIVLPSRGWFDSPAQHVFGDEPAMRRIAADSYVEASRLCFGPSARRDAFVRLLGNMAALADYHEVSWLVACPRAEHAGVYRRMFGFEALAAPRQYYGVQFQTQLMGIRRGDLQHHVRGEKPMMNAWTHALVNLSASTAMAMAS